MPYAAAADRYDRMTYNRCGRSGLKLPAVSLGLWHNFGGDRPIDTARAIVRRAFDLGVTHFDLANNYGPPYGSAEETFGVCWAGTSARTATAVVVSTKAGYDMWAGPYGEWGSRKYLLGGLCLQSARHPAQNYAQLPAPPRPYQRGRRSDFVRFRAAAGRRPRLGRQPAAPRPGSRRSAHCGVFRVRRHTPASQVIAFARRAITPGSQRSYHHRAPARSLLSSSP